MPIKILVLMEDLKHVAEVKTCLEAAGYEVSIVNSFAKAITFLMDSSIQIIISDVHLENGGNVFDFLGWINSHKIYDRIFFVLFSLEPSALAKYLAEGIAIAARHMGAAKYISMDQFDGLRLAKEIAEICPCESERP